MIRTWIFGMLSKISNDAERERYYFRIHGAEYTYLWGPWMTRYDTFRAYEPPQEARRFGAVAAYFTEQWFQSVEDYEGTRSGGVFSTTPWTPTTTEDKESGAASRPSVLGSALTAAKPTQDLLGKKPPTPEEMPIIRWLRAFKYPDGVSVEDGDKWYLQTYAEQAKQQTGLLKYVSYAGIHTSQMHRVDEMWYQDFAAWRKAVIESPPRYTPPSWEKKEEPFVDMTSTFVRLKPSWDLLRERPWTP
ncbi:MAG: hypothetical protein HY662_02150 [Chloroflexi bacterium]|nr:hypothetical protein [Chloroflexota bacterium]